VEVGGNVIAGMHFFRKLYGVARIVFIRHMQNRTRGTTNKVQKQTKVQQKKTSSVQHVYLKL